jgi:hypothetical protein
VSHGAPSADATGPDQNGVKRAMLASDEKLGLYSALVSDGDG